MILIQSVHQMILIQCKVVVDLQIILVLHLLQILHKPCTIYRRRKSYGTSIEKLSSSKQGVKIKKVFAKPKSRTKDLTNLVGYVNGQPYYGDFHIHEREKMEELLKWLVLHILQHLMKSYMIQFKRV